MLSVQLELVNKYHEPPSSPWRIQDVLAPKFPIHADVEYQPLGGRVLGFRGSGFRGSGAGVSGFRVQYGVWLGLFFFFPCVSASSGTKWVVSGRECAC